MSSFMTLNTVDRSIELRPTENGNYNLKVQLENQVKVTSITNLIIQVSGFNQGGGQQNGVGGTTQVINPNRAYGRHRVPIAERRRKR